MAYLKLAILVVSSYHSFSQVLYTQDIQIGSLLTSEAKMPFTYGLTVITRSN